MTESLIALGQLLIPDQELSESVESDVHKVPLCQLQGGTRVLGEAETRLVY